MLIWMQFYSNLFTLVIKIFFNEILLSIMRKRPTPLEIYKLLDKSNCRACGKESCLEFAKELIERKVSLDACSHLDLSDQQPNEQKIIELLRPPQRQVIFGNDGRQCVIGGEEVQYRHDLTFYHQTAIAIEIHDELSNWKQTVEYLTNLTISRIEEHLQINALAIRCVSQDATKFVQVVHDITAVTNLPLILCTLDPQIMEKALEKIAVKRPLLYAATEQNIVQMSQLAIKYHVPLVCQSSDLAILGKMTESLSAMGFEDIVIDPGTYFVPGGFSYTFNQIQQIRTQLFDHDVNSFGYPILGIPATLWTQNAEVISKVAPKDLWQWQYKELLMGTIMEAMDTSLIILHTGRDPAEIWGLLAIMTFRQNLFTDPRVYPTVRTGLYVINQPDDWAPIYITSNYRMTKIPVEQDLVDAKLNGYLIVVDTEGIGIESATAGGQFNEERIKKALDQSKVLEKVKHRIVIIPGMAARLQGPLQDLAKVEVWVGPRDSSAIPEFIQEKWKSEEIQKKYTN